MSKEDLAFLGRYELIDLVVTKHAQLEALRTDYEVLKRKLLKG